MTGSPSVPRVARESVAVTCGDCGVETTVPFTPTPGRPVYCRACFAKRSPGTGGPRSGPGGPRGGGAPRFRQHENTLNRTAPRKRMLAQGRKGHFVYDALDVLERGGSIPENERRAFVETLFSRGARQSSEAAYEYLVEKHKEKQITDEEAKRLTRLLEQYSFWR